MATELRSHNEAPDVRISPKSPFESSKITELDLPIQTLRRAAYVYRAAIWYSVAYCSTMIMEYYTNAMGTMFFTQASFLGQYGDTKGIDGNIEVNGGWMFAVGAVNLLTCIVGSMFNGWYSEKYGQRKAVILGLIFFSFSIPVAALAPKIQVVVLGTFLIGLPLGAFSNLGITYAADVCPPRVRSYVLCYANACHAAGQLMATIMFLAFLNVPDIVSFRVPWMLTCACSVSLLWAVWKSPESPNWLIRKERTEDARAALRRLMRHGNEAEVERRLKVIAIINEREKKIAIKVSFRECFRRQNLRLTFLTLMVAFSSWASGHAMAGHAVYLLRSTGMAGLWTYLFPLLQCIFGIAANVVACMLIDSAGRRPIFMNGLAACAAVLMLTGIFGFFLGRPKPHEGLGPGPLVGWFIGALIVVYAMVRNATVGPISQILYTEIPTTRLRQKATAIARSFQFLLSFGNTLLLPELLSSKALDLSATTGLIFAGTSVIGYGLCSLFLEETKQCEEEEAEMLGMII